MNVFVMIIMAVMMATYQYFVAKRRDGVNFDKDKIELEIKLDCLLRNNSAAFSLNDSIMSEGILAGGLLIENSAKCAGHESIRTYKYCLDKNGRPASCDSIKTSGEHCIATAADFEVPSGRRSMLFKLGIGGVEDLGADGAAIEGKSVPLAMLSQDGAEAFGLTRCTPSAQIFIRQEALKDQCGAGMFSELQEDGTFACAPIPNINPCTSHEDHLDKEEDEEDIALRAHCIEASETTLCCAKPPGSVCGTSPLAAPVWNPTTRFYYCSNGGSACPSELSMDVKDETGATISSALATDPYTARYDTDAAAFACIPNQASMAAACRAAAASSGHAFEKVEGLSGPGGEIACRVSSAVSQSAVENCSACGVPTLVNGRWQCSYKSSWTDLRAAGPEYYDLLKGSGRTGASGCFAGCGPYEEARIKAGARNGQNWGLVWRESSKTWECFHCTQSYYNGACGSPQADESVCAASAAEGQCQPKQCNTLYQVIMATSGNAPSDGACYTKWCRFRPSEADVRVGRGGEKSCEDVPGYPFMMYNAEKDCLYCTRPPPEILPE